MIRKAIQDICDNDIVAREILTSDFQVILGEGITLKRTYINRLRDLGVTEVFVRDFIEEATGKETENVPGTAPGESAEKETRTAPGESAEKETRTALGEVAGKENENISGKVSGREIENAPGRARGESAGKESGTAFGEVAGKESENISGKVSGREIENTPGRVRGESAEKETRTALGEVARKENENISGKVSGREIENAPGRAPGKMTRKEKSDPTIKITEIVILKEEVKKEISETVKEILERHTYHQNEDLKKLTETANDIITTILEEDRVVEKIFDIKERSSDIYEHSIQVCATAILTALKMGVEKGKIQEIGVGCLLHDIGLRYLIIDYDNRDINTLKVNQQTEYKKHPAYGYSSLLEEEWISPLSKNIILYHHEKLDGQGFPLHTGRIPFECRIVSVCDTFDELICGIACRRMKVHEAIEYLKNYESIWFDREVVNAFLSFTAVYPVGTRVVTNEGELAVVIGQNKDFQNRPILQIITDKDGRQVTGKVIKDLIKINNIFIERTVN